MQARPPKNEGFTRIDLLFVLVTLAFLLGLFAPAFARSETGSRTIECLANKRKIMGAWASYALDNADHLPGVLTIPDALNPTASTMATYRQWASGVMDWSSSGGNTNTLFLTDPRYSSISPYLGSDAAVFRCPADQYLGAQQKARGWAGRVRSVSSSASIGPNSGFLDSDSYFLGGIRKSSHFVKQPPSAIWVFLDEHPDSINDPMFIPPSPTAWLDLVAAFHDRGTAFGMADGSVVLHRWTSPRTIAPVRFIFPSVIADRSDIAWVREHTPHR